MASQLGRVTRDPRLKRNQDAELQARLRFLPQIMQNKSARKVEAKRDAQFEKSFALEQDKFSLAKKRRKAEKKASEAGMGMEAAKLGTSLAFSPMGSENLGQTLGINKGIFSGGNVGVGTGQTGQKATGQGQKAGLLGGLKLGSGVSSALTGFGAGRIAGGSKKKRALIGAGAGSLMGLLSGGKSDSFKQAGLKAGIGGLLGGLGGLF